ncbi:MAG: fumarate hydratase [Candidatus Latescibacteria bacterium]|nr:fumarate hydratase [bacterium]MBD3424987.1 fumarate hydratase [Candidatus Latescibacterota bacterium]
MKEIEAGRIAEVVGKLCQEANFELEDDVQEGLEKMFEEEESPAGKEVMRQILENSRIARTEKLPLCQDTGYLVVFAELGQDVHITGGGFEDAINEGVRNGYADGYLRKSILADPVRGGNTKDNTPAVIHLRLVPGDKLKLYIVPKGGGSENMSRIAMMKPADGVEGIKDFVVNGVREASGNPCPPIMVGVGIGGTFEMCAQLAKKALLRPVGSTHEDPFYDKLEKELLELVNRTGVGPAGLGGRCTAFAVHIETAPRHIASFPVAMNINCHSARHKYVEL